MSLNADEEQWVRVRKLILAELERHERAIQELDKLYHETDKQIAIMQTKSAMIAAIIGAVVGIAAKFIDKV